MHCIQSLSDGFINYIEFKRPLVTGDSAGKDIDLVEGNIYNMKFASNGKATYHKSPEDRHIHTFAISQLTSPGTNTSTTTTPTSTKTPQQLKDENILTFFVLAGFGLALNILLIAMIFIFQRRKVL